jgi:hypothetical protein
MASYQQLIKQTTEIPAAALLIQSSGHANP